MKGEKVGHIILLIIFNVFLGLCIWGTCFFAFLKYPTENELILEKCTFIYYKLKSIDENGKNRICYIYTEEYEDPLEIDQIVFSDIHKKKISSLQYGDEIIVSIRHYNNNYTIYYLSYNEEKILSYDEFLERHNANNKAGVVLMCIIDGILLFLIVFEVVHYNKTGYCIPL